MESLLVSFLFFFSIYLPSLLSILFPLSAPPPQTYILSKIKEPLQVSTTISQFFEQKEKNQIKERELKEKRAKIKAFQGLPPVSIFFLKKGPYHLLILTTTTTTKTIKSFYFFDQTWYIDFFFFFLLFFRFISFFFFFFWFQNLELARHELRAARQKQMELIQLRERLLDRMADGVAWKIFFFCSYRFWVLNSFFFFSPWPPNEKNFSTSRLLQS